VDNKHKKGPRVVKTSRTIAPWASGRWWLSKWLEETDELMIFLGVTPKVSQTGSDQAAKICVSCGRSRPGSWVHWSRQRLSSSAPTSWIRLGRLRPNNNFIIIAKKLFCQLRTTT